MLVKVTVMGLWDATRHLSLKGVESGNTAVVKSLLTVTTLLQQILDCGCCAQCKWR